MEYPLPEIIDRITILRLKIEHSDNPVFKEQLNAFHNALIEFKLRGINIKLEWINKLYKINKSQWKIESLFKEAKEKNYLEEMGKLYIKICLSNKERTKVKNEISEITGQGFKDIKVN